VGVESGAAGRPPCPHLQRQGRWRRRAGRRVDRPAASGRGTASGGGGRGFGSTTLPSAVQAQPAGEEGGAAGLPTCPQLRRHGRWRGRAERRVDLSPFSGKGRPALSGEGTDGGTAVQKEQSAAVPPPAKERPDTSGAPQWRGAHGSRGSTAQTSSACGASYCRSESHFLEQDLSAATTHRLVRTALPVPAVKRVAAGDLDTGFSPPTHLAGHVPNRSLLYTAVNGAFLVRCGLLYHDATRWYEFTLCLCMFLLVSMVRSG